MTTSDTTPPASDSIKIEPLNFTDDLQLHEASELIYEALLPVSSALPTREAALGELLDLGREENCITLAASDRTMGITGIISASALVIGEVATLKMLAVKDSARRQGAGRALIVEIEAALAKAGYQTLWVGFGDEAGLTSLAGKDLYPDPLARLETLEFPPDHPLRFLLAVGFSIVGVLPDAHGPGAHRFDLAKRIRSI